MGAAAPSGAAQGLDVCVLLLNFVFLGFFFLNFVFDQLTGEALIQF